MYFPLFSTLLAMGDLFLFIPEAPTVLPLFEFEFKFKSVSSSSYETIQLLTPFPIDVYSSHIANTKPSNAFSGHLMQSTTSGAS